MMKKIQTFITVMCVIFGGGLLASCKSQPTADLVVYGKIFTSENNQVAEAFAVKDGKYADFLLVNKNVTYFEGYKVFPLNK